MCNLNKGIFIIIVLVFLGNVALPAKSSILDFDINSDWEMDRRYDWVVDVKVIDTDYLSYPGSKLKPLTKLLISYRLNPRFGETAGKFIKYEELWYQVGRTIGCRRLHDLDIPATYQGAIRIIPSDSASKNSGAISGAIVRLLLDIGLRNCMLSAVFIPRDAYEETVNDLTRFSFFSNGQISAGSLKLSVYSNPLYTNPSSFAGTLYFCQ